MSMSRGCITVEWDNGRWYCITAHDEYDYEFESFTVTGSFSNEEKAIDGQDGCNPGSWTTERLNGKTPKEAYLKWIVDAIEK